MPDPVYPVELPSPLLTGYSFSDDLPLIRTQMESGPERVTRTSSSYATNINFSLILTRDQLAIFRNFFENTINAGADWFDVQLDSAGTYVTHRTRFIQSPSYSIQRPFYRVNCAVEVDQRQIVLP
jgi:hypothetical protein